MEENKMNILGGILEELYNKTGMQLGELLADFESGYKLPLQLKYKEAYREDGKIIVKVIDEISKCPFDLYFDEETLKLKMV